MVWVGALAARRLVLRAAGALGLLGFMARFTPLYVFLSESCVTEPSGEVTCVAGDVPLGRSVTVTVTVTGRMYDFVRARCLPHVYSVLATVLASRKTEFSIGSPTTVEAQARGGP